MTAPLLKMTCHSSPRLADGLEHGGLVRLPGRDDCVADGERIDATCLEALDERRWRCRPERRLLARLGTVEQRAVLGDDPIEQVEARKRVLEVGELAAGDHQQPPARPGELRQRGDHAIVDVPVAGEGAVVVAGEGVVAHARDALNVTSDP